MMRIHRFESPRISRGKTREKIICYFHIHNTIYMCNYKCKRKYGNARRTVISAHNATRYYVNDVANFVTVIVVAVCYDILQIKIWNAQKKVSSEIIGTNV